MSIVLRALAVAAVAALTLGACSSNSDSTASSTPATAVTTTTAATSATSATLAPGTTAIGAPVPIGGATTLAGDPSTTGPATGDTTTASTDGGATTPPAGTDGDTSPAEPAPTDDSTSATSSASNANTAFCQFEAKVQQASDEADDDAEFLAALAQLYPDMEQWVASAPNNTLRQGASALRDATKASIDAGNLDPLDTDDATEALLDIELFCQTSETT